MEKQSILMPTTMEIRNCGCSHSHIKVICSPVKTTSCKCIAEKEPRIKTFQVHLRNVTKVRVCSRRIAELMLVLRTVNHLTCVCLYKKSIKNPRKLVIHTLSRARLYYPITEVETELTLKGNDWTP